MRRKNILSSILLSISIAVFGMFLLTGCGCSTHEYGQWQQQSQATCTKAEVLIRKCKNCNHKEKQEGEPALGHSFIEHEIIEPTQTENGYTLYRCHCEERKKDNYTCLLTYENMTEDKSIDANSLPVFNPQKVNLNSAYEGLTGNSEYMPVEYRIYKNPTYYENLYQYQIIKKSTKINVVWDKVKNDELTETEITFNELISKIKLLEDISNQYNIEKSSSVNPQIRVMQYIRQTRYSSSQWNSFAGTIESDFAEYVTQNQGENNLSALQTTQYITIPSTNEKVDFVHMIAIINVATKGSVGNHTINDLVGWGGDLCQLALELKNTNLTGEELQEKAYTLFNSENSTFSSSDLLADLDALNIAKIFEATEITHKSLSNILSQYYKNISVSKRKQSFLSIAFPSCFNTTNGEILTTQTQMADYIVSRLSDNLYIQLWCMKNGISFSSNADKVKAATMAFAKYFIN